MCKASCCTGCCLPAAAAIVGSIYSPGVAEAPKRLTGSLAVFTVVGAGVFALIFLLTVIRWIGSRARRIAHPSYLAPDWNFIRFLHRLPDGRIAPACLRDTLKCHKLHIAGHARKRPVGLRVPCSPQIIHIRSLGAVCRIPRRPNLRYRRLAHRHTQQDELSARLLRPLDRIIRRHAATHTPLGVRRRSLAVRCRPLGYRNRHRRRHPPIHRHWPHRSSSPQ